MGHFSYLCAKTGLPILGSDTGGSKFSDVVVLRPDGSVSRGTYDGYGRVSGDRHLDDDSSIADKRGARMVLAHFYAGERYDQFADCQPDPHQGAGVHEDFDEWMFLAKEHVPDFDSHDYPARSLDFFDLCHKVAAGRAEIHGVDVGALQETRWVAPRLAYCQERDDFEHELKSVWPKLASQFPGASFPQGHRFHGVAPQDVVASLEEERRAVEKMLAREVIDAWVQKRPTRAPNVEALLSGDSAAGWKDAPLARPTRRFRP